MIPAILCGLFGLAFGSFLNVCITRLPLDESVASPGSHCRQCGARVLKRDNIPVLSWIFLRARCRSCNSRIPLRYPLMELCTSALFVMCWLRFGADWQAGAWAVLCFLLLGLAAMDAETMLLPNQWTIPGLILGILVRGAESAAKAPNPGLGTRLEFGLRSAAAAVLDAGIAAGLLLCILGAYWLVRKRTGMGMGDVKLVALLAAWLGLPRTALVFFLAVIFGAVYGVALLATKRGRSPGGALSIPFGTFLSLAGLYGIFLGERTVSWYMKLFR